MSRIMRGRSSSECGWCWMLLFIREVWIILSRVRGTIGAFVWGKKANVISRLWIWPFLKSGCAVTLYSTVSGPPPQHHHIYSIFSKHLLLCSRAAPRVGDWSRQNGCRGTVLFISTWLHLWLFSTAKEVQGQGRCIFDLRRRFCRCWCCICRGGVRDDRFWMNFSGGRCWTIYRCGCIDLCDWFWWISQLTSGCVQVP